MSHLVNRRNFLAGSAALAGTAALAGATAAFADEEAAAPAAYQYALSPGDVADLEQVETGVLVIGGGGAGISAAISAAQAGADVILLEKTGIMGGATILSAGKIPAVGTQEQIAKGVKDTVWALCNDIFRPNNHSVREDLVYTAGSAAKDIVEWTGEMGVTWTVDDALYYGQTNYRMHTADGAGNGLTTTMIDFLGSLDNAEVRTDSEVLGLIYDEAEGVLGAYTADAAYLADNVVLATSGFGNNPDMIEQYCPEAANSVKIVAPGATGEGIRWAEELGARLRCMGAYQGYAFHTVDDDQSGEQTLANNGAIFVNAEGMRFANEFGGYSELTPNILTQTNGWVWEIFTDAQKETSGMWDSYEANGIVHTAETVEDLAAELDLPADALAATIDEYKAGIEAGMDSFNRSHLPADFEGPYYAIKITGEIRHTQGGMSTDVAGHVLKEDGTLIPGLYAAGGCTEGFSSTGGPAYMSGNGVLQALAFGKIAGEHAASETRGSAQIVEWDGDRGF